MSPTQARALLKSAGMTPADAARVMILLGDARPFSVVLRGLHHVLAGARAEDVPHAWAALIAILALPETGPALARLALEREAETGFERSG